MKFLESFKFDSKEAFEKLIALAESYGYPVWKQTFTNEPYADALCAHIKTKKCIYRIYIHNGKIQYWAWFVLDFDNPPLGNLPNFTEEFQFNLFTFRHAYNSLNKWLKVTAEDDLLSI